jgi:hypothetical protein
MKLVAGARALTVVALLLAAGCAARPHQAPVEDRAEAPAAPAPAAVVTPPPPQEPESSVIVRPLRGEDEALPPAAVEPPPVLERQAAPEPSRVPEPYQPPSAPEPPVVVTPPAPPATDQSDWGAPPGTSSAVVALLDSAGEQVRSGRLDASAATLERALRIEPQNAHIWSQLADVRLKQERFEQAEGLASRSNNLAAGDRMLQARNWRIIAESRRLRGDAAGARAAAAQAQQLAR